MEIVRIYDLSDNPDIIHLFDEYRKYYKQPSDIDKTERYLNERLANNESIIFVAKNKEKTIGFTQLYSGFSSLYMKSLWTLNDLFVIEEHRNKGIGKLLLDAAYQLGKSSQWRGMVLETGIHNPAQHLYEREGWKKDEEYFHYGIYY